MSHSNPVRWGILGAARVNERLLPAIVSARNANLVAIASRRPGAAQETLERYAPEHTDVSFHDRLEDLLARNDLDAVYIPLGNAEHVEWTIKAIEKGIHVLCEKPMALKVGDIERIIEASRLGNIKVMEGFMYRFHPQHQRVAELLHSGLIGEIRSVKTSFSFMMKPARLYRLSSGIDEGGGAIWDIGCYAIHAARMWFKTPPLSLYATMHCMENGADTSGCGIIDFGHGQRSHFDYGFDTTRRSEYLITGTKGTLSCPTVWQLPGDSPRISWTTEDGRSGEEMLEPHDHFRLEIEGFSNAILLNEAPLLSLEDALENCRLLNATIDSVRSGKKVYLSN